MLISVVIFKYTLPLNKAIYQGSIPVKESQSYIHYVRTIMRERLRLVGDFNGSIGARK